MHLMKLYICMLGLVWSSTACLVADEDAMLSDRSDDDVGELSVDDAEAATSPLLTTPHASVLEVDGDDVKAADAASATAVRYCSGEFDCNTACACIGGTCQPDGFGPPPPEGHCTQPPQRACSVTSDCRSACVCNGGTCQPDGFGPPPPADYCAQPPPDMYEYDNIATSAANYLGSPQLGHTFHDVGDVDWILVYFGVAMTARFETYNLSGASNTYLEVYAYNYATGQVGSLVAANDNVCGYYWSQICLASRAVVNVPANSVYAVRVRNTATADSGRTVYDQVAPRYDFRIY